MGSMMKRKSFRLLAMVLAMVMVIGLVPVSAAKKKSVTVSSLTDLYAKMTKSNVGKITYESNAAEKLTIYVKKLSKSEKAVIADIDLVINAPEATITNKLKFKSVTIKACKAYTEAANGNTITLADPETKFTVAKKKQVEKLTVKAAKANVVVKAKANIMDLVVAKKNAKVTVNAAKGSDVDVTISKKAAVTVKGNKKADVDITNKASGSTVTASIPVEISTKKNINVNTKKGSEGTVIDASSSKIKVNVKNTGKEEPKLTVKGEEVTATPTPTAKVTPVPTATPTPTEAAVIIDNSGSGSSSGGGYSGGSATVTPSPVPTAIPTNSAYFEGMYGNVEYVTREYDNKGRLLKVKTLGTHYNSGIETYTYDEKGNLTATFGNGSVLKPLYDASGNFIGSAGYRGDKFLNSSEFTYEQNGNICIEKEVEKGWDGIIESCYEYEYDTSYKDPQYEDDEGRILKTTQSGLDGKVLYVTEYEYDTQGRQIRIIEKDGSGKITNISEREFGSDLNTWTWTYKDGNGRITGYSEETWSDAGKKKLSIFKNVSGRITGSEEYTNTENGYKYVNKNALGAVIDTEEVEFATDSEGILYDKKRVVTDRTGKITYLAEYDEKNRQIRYISGDWSDYEYTYDDAANKVTVLSKSKNKNDQYTGVYTFDSSTGTIKFVKTNGYGETWEYLYEYDSNGRLVKRTEVYARTKDKNIIEYTYGSNGLVETETWKNAKGVIKYVTTHKYNEYGSKVESETKNSDGNVVESQTYEYHKNGSVKTSTDKYEWGSWTYEYDVDGTETGYIDYDGDGNEVYSYHYTMDENGNRTFESRKNSDGSTEEIVYEDGYSKESTRKDSSGVVTVTTYGYDEAHNLISEEIKDASGNPVGSGSFTYDADGNILTIVYKDSAGKDISTQTYTYDDYGRQITLVDKGNNYESSTTKKYYDNDFASEEVIVNKINVGTEDETVSTTTTTYHENGNDKSRITVSLDNTRFEGEYNENGDPLSESYYDASGTITAEDVYTYYESGSLKTHIAKNSAGRTESSFNEDENPLRYAEYDAAGNPVCIEETEYENRIRVHLTREFPGQSRQVYTYNSDGDDLTEIRYEIDEEGNEVQTYSRTCTYDDEGRLESEIKKNLSGIEESYYKDGEIERYVEKDLDGKMIYENTGYTYDDNDRVITYTSVYYDGEGNVYSSVKHLFDYFANGRTKSERYEYSSGALRIVVYSETGYYDVLEDTSWDSEGNITTQTVNTYNEKGHHTKYIHTDFEEGFKEEQEYTGTEPNRTIKETKTDLEGNLQHKWENSYNEDGYCTLKVYTSNDYIEELYLDGSSDEIMTKCVETYLDAQGNMTDRRETEYDGTDEHNITKEIVTSNYYVYAPYARINNDYTGDEYYVSNIAVTGSAISFVKCEKDYAADETFTGSTVYVITDEGQEIEYAYYMFITTDEYYIAGKYYLFNENTYMEVYDADGNFVYSCGHDKDDNVIPGSENGTNPFAT